MRVDVVNFKSYGGRRTIGPFVNFTAVIGPNGAGKSNLMDALSFVVGLRSSELRGKQLKDLIFRCSSDKGDEQRSASVALVFECDGEETIFKRSINSAGVGEYRINGRVVKAEAYAEKLDSLNIMTKAHTGFLVPQGYVSELAAKSPADLTELVEQISGSHDLKEEYERLSHEKKRAEDEQSYSYQKKKLLTQERTNVRKQKEEAERYNELLEKREQLNRKLYLTRLFSIEKEVTELNSLVEQSRAACEAEAEKHKEIAANVDAKESEKARQARKVIELERKAVALTQQIDNLSPEQIQLQEEITHATKRKKMSQKSLEKLLEQQQKSEQQVATLKDELKQIKAQTKRVEEEAKKAQSGGEIEMGEKQRAEYTRLKAQAGKETAELVEKIARKRRELRDLEPTLVQLRSKVDQLGNEQRVSESTVSTLEQRRAAAQERVKEISAALKKLKSQGSQLAAQVCKFHPCLYKTPRLVLPILSYTSHPFSPLGR